MNTPSTSVSPGLGGFIAFFVLALALWLLMRNMNARLRRMRFREEDEARRQGTLETTRGGATGAAGDDQAGGDNQAGDVQAGDEQAGDDDAAPAQSGEEPGGSTRTATRGEDDRRPPAQG
jgi:hypothetical protein